MNAGAAAPEPPGGARWGGVRASAIAAVAVGGVAGAEARLGVEQLMPHPRTGFPWSTVLINTTGCLLVGALVAVLLRYATNPLVRLSLVVGLLGGYTTFSAYTVDAVRLLDGGRPAAAAAYVGVTLLLALAAVLAGSAVADRALTLLGRGSGGADVAGDA